LIKINGDTVELRTDYGTLLRIITNNAQYAELSLDNKMVLVTRLDGVVDLRGSYGMMMRQIATELDLMEMR